MSIRSISIEQRLIEVGIALSAEKNLGELLTKIVDCAMEITGSDGASLYTVSQNNSLHFEIMKNISLGLDIHGDQKNDFLHPPIQMYKADGIPDLSKMSVYSACEKEILNIRDVYQERRFDLSGVKNFDEKFHYKTLAILTVPLTDHESEIIGVLQLVNPINRTTNSTISFSKEDETNVTFLSAQAATALNNRQLIDSLTTLFEKFSEVIAYAIDEKSPYTGGHCRRVPAVAMMMAQAVNNSKQGELKDTYFSSQELYELNLAALLHDCGKITVPVHVVDKATKLEKIFDRVELINLRIDYIKKDLECEFYKNLANQSINEDILERVTQVYEDEIALLNQYKKLINRSNLGSEYLNDKIIDELDEIRQLMWRKPCGDIENLLSDDEFKNLTIRRGTLSDDERKIINSHITTTINMLEKLPFPKSLSSVLEIAGSHHERVDGKGYPKGITGNEMSLQAKILCIADVFEALTASDRPYKKAMKLSESLKILERMAIENHLDKDVLDVFKKEKVYLNYATEFLDSDQIDI